MNSLLQRVQILILLLTVLSLSSCAGKQGGYGGPPPIPVSLVPLESKPLSEQISLLGESRSQSDGSLKTLTPGVISQLLVDVGDSVTAGQKVAYLDGVEQRIALAEAEAELARGESVQRELTNGTRPTVLRQREAERRAARARVYDAESRLKSVTALGPQRVKQAEGDYEVARAAEQNAADEFRRTQELVKNGALSSRDLVKVRSAWDMAKGELLRAEQARSVQATNNERDRAEALASLEGAKADYARYEALLAESQEGPRPEVIAAQREMVSALRAARDRAAVEYDRTAIRSSASGTIKSRLAAVGDRLEAGDPVFELAGEDTDFYFEAPENVQGKVERGQIVLLRQGAESEAVEGEVVGVAQGVNTGSRRQALRVKAPDSGFLPGSTVNGTLLIPVKGDYFTTHRDCLVDKKGRWVVFTINQDKKAVEHTVEFLAGVGERVAISAPDLKSGMELVKRGAPALYPDAVVRPPAVPTATPSPEASAKE